MGKRDLTEKQRAALEEGRRVRAANLAKEQADRKAALDRSTLRYGKLDGDKGTGGTGGKRRSTSKRAPVADRSTRRSQPVNERTQRSTGGGGLLGAFAQGLFGR